VPTATFIHHSTTRIRIVHIQTTIEIADTKMITNNGGKLLILQQNAAFWDMYW